MWLDQFLQYNEFCFYNEFSNLRDNVIMKEKYIPDNFLRVEVMYSENLTTHCFKMNLQCTLFFFHLLKILKTTIRMQQVF